MGVLARLRRAFGAKERRHMVMVPLRARYDAAQTTAENATYYGQADYLSPDVSMSAAVRKTLRSRSRYEIANNCLVAGMVQTRANDIIGTGPVLQMLTGDSKLNRKIERAYSDWVRLVGWNEKLQLMARAKIGDGETFAVKMTNGALPNVKLDYLVLEADQFTDPAQAFAMPDEADGIKRDESDRPVTYRVLTAHPGSGQIMKGPGYKDLQARDVIHWFRRTRPGQHRGIPEITPALPLGGQLRRYTLAVIQAAEAAADPAVMMKTTSPPSGESAEIEDMKTPLAWEKGMAIFVPEGWEPAQIKAEQPTTTYQMFKREILTEAARCLDMPYNIAACDSSSYNYASGRLDHQTYYRSISVDQDHAEFVVLDPAFYAWYEEARYVHQFPPLPELPHQWMWPGRDHVDPEREANAQSTRLTSGTTTLAAEAARQGWDWEALIVQRSKEIALCRKAGVPVPGEKGAAEKPASETKKEPQDGQDGGEEKTDDEKAS